MLGDHPKYNGRGPLRSRIGRSACSRLLITAADIAGLARRDKTLAEIVEDTPAATHRISTVVNYFLKALARLAAADEHRVEVDFGIDDFWADKCVLALFCQDY